MYLQWLKPVLILCGCGFTFPAFWPWCTYDPGVGWLNCYRPRLCILTSDKFSADQLLSCLSAQSHKCHLCWERKMGTVLLNWLLWKCTLSCVRATQVTTSGHFVLDLKIPFILMLSVKVIITNICSILNSESERLAHKKGGRKAAWCSIIV